MPDRPIAPTNPDAAQAAVQAVGQGGPLNEGTVVVLTLHFAEAVTSIYSVDPVHIVILYGYFAPAVGPFASSISSISPPSRDCMFSYIVELVTPSTYCVSICAFPLCQVVFMLFI